MFTRVKCSSIDCVHNNSRCYCGREDMFLDDIIVNGERRFVCKNYTLKDMTPREKELADFKMVVTRAKREVAAHG